MLRRHLGLVRACSAAGLSFGLLLGSHAPARAADALLDTQTDRSIPGPESVSILDAKSAGDLDVKARGNGQYHVKLTLKNNSAKRLNVIIPPGLVASSSAGQRGGGNGFQSMGLGSVRNAPGAFGDFQGLGSSPESGFRSVSVSPKLEKTIAVQAGETVEIPMASVCLNYGMPTPTSKDSFELLAVEDFTKDVRVHKALKSLIALGTSQGVAQAAMWRVCNDVPFDVMAKEPSKTMNSYEIALASRFVDALDASGSSELVDPSYLKEGRLYIRVLGEGELAKEASRMMENLDGQILLGLRARPFREGDAPKIQGPALLFDVALLPSKFGESRARVVMNSMTANKGWDAIGKFTFQENSSVNVMDSPRLAAGLERSITANYVTVRPVGRGKGVTSFKVENRLPFTVGSISLRAGESLGAASVPFNGLGIAPARSSSVLIQAPTVSIDRVELNGL